jgi:uncharacterized membrane protein
LMESQKRTVAKAVTFRLVALLVTVPITGFKVALSLQIILFILYYVHERMWLRVEWGR